MPELPEVETIRRYLCSCLVDRCISSVRLARKDLRFPFPARFCERLAGARITALKRRGKYLAIFCVKDDTSFIWLVHLGMSGRLLWFSEGADGLGIDHRHVCADMVCGGALCYDDVRRFGFMDLCAGTDMDNDCERLRHLGIEPLSNRFNGRWLWEEVSKKSKSSKNSGGKAIKDILMDQRYVAGLGNIYVTECLWDAMVHPMRKIHDLTLDECEQIVKGVRKVLRLAIDAGGSSLRDYRQGDGSLGYFQLMLRAYARAGKECLRVGCDGTINKITIGGRSSFFCSKLKT